MRGRSHRPIRGGLLRWPLFECQAQMTSGGNGAPARAGAAAEDPGGIPRFAAVATRARVSRIAALRPERPASAEARARFELAKRFCPHRLQAHQPEAGMRFGSRFLHRDSLILDQHGEDSLAAGDRIASAPLCGSVGPGRGLAAPDAASSDRMRSGRVPDCRLTRRPDRRPPETRAGWPKRPPPPRVVPQGRSPYLPPRAPGGLGSKTAHRRRVFHQDRVSRVAIMATAMAPSCRIRPRTAEPSRQQPTCRPGGPCAFLKNSRSARRKTLPASGCGDERRTSLAGLAESNLKLGEGRRLRRSAVSLAVSGRRRTCRRFSL